MTFDTTSNATLQSTSTLESCTPFMSALAIGAVSTNARHVIFFSQIIFLTIFSTCRMFLLKFILTRQKCRMNKHIRMKKKGVNLVQLLVSRPNHQWFELALNNLVTMCREMYMSCVVYFKRKLLLCVNLFVILEVKNISRWLLLGELG